MPNQFILRLAFGALIKLALVFTFFVLGACAANRQPEQSLNEADKFENWNRKVFAFNDTVDRWLLKPVAKGYTVIAPKPVEVGVSNFFSNLGEVRNILNDVLQWKWKQAGNDTGRLLLNSTFGLAGLVDVARTTGLEKSDGEDFGQTLAVWGVPRGSYFVLPFLGPSSIGQLPGIPVDWYSNPVAYIDPDRDRYLVTAADFVQIRAELLEAEDLISGDRYIFIRDAWLQRREYLIKDGEVEDEFGDEFGDEFDE